VVASTVVSWGPSPSLNFAFFKHVMTARPTGAAEIAALIYTRGDPRSPTIDPLVGLRVEVAAAAAVNGCVSITRDGRPLPFNLAVCVGHACDQGGPRG